MVAYLFAGQGSQYIGMGRDLYESFPESKAVFEKADKALGYSLSGLCFAGPQEELVKTQNCQPAVLTVSIAAWEAFSKVTRPPLGCARGKQGHKVTSYAAGLSLGEYSALVAAGAISFEDAVYLVRRRGEFMEEEAAKSPGKMLSVIGLDLPIVKEICVEAGTEIANINCPGQTVISGGTKEIECAQALANKRGARMAVLLEVSGAFHSSFMKGAAIKFASELEKIKLNLPKMRMICNVTAKPVVSIDELRNSLIKQVASSVLWEESMRFILSQGVTRFFEFGPGKVLKGLMRRIDSDAAVVSIEKKDDLLSFFKEEEHAF